MIEARVDESTGRAASLRPAGRGRTLSAGLAGSVIVALCWLILIWDRTINHDTAWYLMSTRDWLAGARLYVDIYEVNPPLNSYLTVPAIFLADAFAISDANGQYLLIALLTAASLWSSWAVLTARAALSGPRRVLAFAGLAMVLTLPALTEVAQREHLMVLLVLPWFLGQIPGRAEPATWHIARAVPAAVGLCLKPHFLAIPAFVALWQVIRTRSLRPAFSPDIIVMVVVGVAYVVAARYLHPEYFADVIPVALDVYGAFGPDSGFVLTWLAVTAAPFTLFALLFLVARERPRASGLFLAGVAGGLASYLLQWNGFNYHFIPITTFGLLLLVWVVLSATRITPLAIAAALSLALCLAIGTFRGIYDYRILPDLRAALGPDTRPQSLFAATTNVAAGPLFAMVLGAEWVGRYPQNWTVPGAVNLLLATDCAADPARCARLGAILDRTRDDNIADIAAARAEVILIDKRNVFIRDPDFSWYAFYESHPRWEALIGAYRLTGQTAGFDVWTRTGGGP